MSNDLSTLWWLTLSIKDVHDKAFMNRSLSMVKLSTAAKSGYQNVDIREVVNAAQEGSSAAFDEIVSRYNSRVHRTALQILRNGDDADDAVQEVFVNVLKHLDSFRHDAAFSTWITRIAINVSLIQLRKVRRHPCVSYNALDTPDATFSDSFESCEPSVEQLLIEQQRRRILSIALSKVPAKLREVTTDRNCYRNRLGMDIQT
jgi:RNA polymerase sigma-70 factor (ECF subfamily)